MLDQIAQRGGAIELSVAPTDAQSEDALSPADLVWRVRLRHVADDGLIVEAPSAAGLSLSIEQGVRLIGAMTVGQNRWMFHAAVTGTEVIDGRQHLHLSAPEQVERCQRRTFNRISTATLQVPEVTAWPMLDPASGVAAEVACKACLEQGIASGVSDDMLPDVGPSFKAKLVNVSGGGLGLLAPREEAGGFDSARYFFLRVDLQPVLKAPLCMTTKLVHRHLDSAQLIHAGMAFDFTFHPEHQAFVAEQIGRCMQAMQDRSLRAAG